MPIERKGVRVALTIILVVALIVTLIALMTLRKENKSLQALISKELLQNINSLVVCVHSNSEELKTIIDKSNVTSEEAVLISECFDTISHSYAYLLKVSDEIYSMKISDRNRLDLLTSHISHYFAQTFKANENTLTDKQLEQLTLINEITTSVLQITGDSFPNTTNNGIVEDHYSSIRASYIKADEWRDYIASIQQYAKELDDNYITQIVN